MEVDYERFKRNYETFSGKLDTPEKLQAFNHQYVQYKERMEHNDYFEPYETASGMDWLACYHDRLNTLLGFNKLKEGQLYFMTVPSFTAESILMVEVGEGAYSLKYYILEENYWLRYDKDRALTTIPGMLSEGVLEKHSGDQLFELVKLIVAEVRLPYPGWFTLDGTGRIISMIIDGKRVDIHKNASEHTKPDRVFALFDAIIALTGPNADKAAVDKLMAEVQSLYQ